jgi:Gas vesicle protein
MSASSQAFPEQYGGQAVMGQPSNLGDILERVLDKGLVIVGDIRISLLDIELLTIKLRLLVASVDTAKQLGIDWWEHDAWLSSSARQAVGPAESANSPLPAGTRQAIGRAGKAPQRMDDIEEDHDVG